MEHVLTLLREPVVVCILAALIGVGAGLAYELRNPRALAGAAAAAAVASALISSLASEATLAAPALILGFAITAMIRDWIGRKMADRHANEVATRPSGALPTNPSRD